MASAAQTGSLPVANATNVSSKLEPAAITATRRATPDGPADAAAATIAPARAASNVALNWGRGAPSATPAKSPQTRYRTSPHAGGAPVEVKRRRQSGRSGVASAAPLWLRRPVDIEASLERSPAAVQT